MGRSPFMLRPKGMSRTSRPRRRRSPLWSREMNEKLWGLPGPASAWAPGQEPRGRPTAPLERPDVLQAEGPRVELQAQVLQVQAQLVLQHLAAHALRVVAGRIDIVVGHRPAVGLARP